MATRRARPEPFMVRGALFTLRRRCGKPELPLRERGGP